VPAFRPDAIELLALVTSLRAQSVPVVVADDASPCTSDALLRDVVALGAEVVRHERNAGIARSLNDGLTRARELNAEWLLTVDQDSVLVDDYVARIVTAAAAAEVDLGCERVGAVAAGRIEDASGLLSYPVTFQAGTATTQEAIQTGTIWRVSALAACGGFDETLGIDAVDAAACLRLREHGQHVVLATDLSIGHRVGEGRQVSVLGRSVLASGHSPERRTTIVRNRLRLFPAEFAQSPVHALRTLRRVAVNTVLAVTIEDDRWAKAKASARGVFPSRGR
jgi:GT2 family glycosyltransferase